MAPEDPLTGLARAIRGRLGMDPRPPGYTETVNVVGKLPDPMAPMPRGSEDLLLGTATQKPQGSYTPPDTGQRPRVNLEGYPKIQAAWENVAKRHPYVANQIEAVSPVKNLGASAMYVPGWDPRYNRGIQIDTSAEQQDPADIESSLVHEMVHKTQREAFPSSLDYLRRWVPPLTSYRERPGEVQAYGTEAASALERAGMGEIGGKFVPLAQLAKLQKKP